MKRTKNMVIRETIESRELELYAENDGKLYFSMIVPAVKNLAKKYKKGTFDADKAIDAFYYVADEAARRYCKEFGNGKQMFSVTDRFTCAAGLLDYYLENIQENNL